MRDSIKSFIESGKLESYNHQHAYGERADLYHSVDNQGVELEFGIFLLGLVLSLKPGLILETGTYHGLSTKFLADGCSINGIGKIISLELDPECVGQARANLKDYTNIVQIENHNSIEWLQSYRGLRFQLAILDSDLKARVEELKIIRDRRLMAPGGMVFIHDTSRMRQLECKDYPEFPHELDKFGIPNIECGFSRGWRLFQL